MFELYNNKIIFLIFAEDTLLKNDQIEQMAFLSLCEGDVETVLQTAASRNCLTDSLINSASMCECQLCVDV